jgi:hypothetical protein
MLNVKHGQQVDLRVAHRMMEDYAPAAKKMKPFSGAGQRLGGFVFFTLDTEMNLMIGKVVRAVELIVVFDARKLPRVFWCLYRSTCCDHPKDFVRGRQQQASHVYPDKTCRRN